MSMLVRGMERKRWPKHISGVEHYAYTEKATKHATHVKTSVGKHNSL
jgi:hypothetical protein